MKSREKNMKVEKMEVSIEQSRLDLLQLKLEITEIAEDAGNENWQYGTNANYLSELLAYWKNCYDWRAVEAEINQYPHFRCTIDDVPVHFIHIKCGHPDARPLLLLHGWPWTFWDYQKVIKKLTSDQNTGASISQGFDLIIPSLPGFVFSSPLESTGINFWNTADILTKLMTTLGYEKFGVHGHDWGAIIAAQLAHKYASNLIGAHFTTLLPLDTFTGGGVDKSYFSGNESHYIEKNERFFSDGGGYFSIQTTRPQSLAYALNDSPIGLLAWILEKRRDWSDCDGDVESVFSKDDLITTAMLYWANSTIGTSMRYYYEAAHNPWKPSHNRKPVVEAPCGIAVFPKEVVLQPEAWIREYYNVKQLTHMKRGGHFAAMEEPNLLSSDIRSFFDSL